jgi:biotin transporter BioY
MKGVHVPCFHLNELSGMVIIDALGWPMFSSTATSLRILALNSSGFEWDISIKAMILGIVAQKHDSIEKRVPILGALTVGSIL